VLHSISKSGHATATGDCNTGTAVRVPGSQHFIRWSLSIHSSQYVAVTAFTAAGCNSLLTYEPIFIQTKQQGLQIIFKFLFYFCTYTDLTDCAAYYCSELVFLPAMFNSCVSI